MPDQKFNHVYSIPFTVRSNKANGSDVTSVDLKKYLLARIFDLLDEDYLEACGGPQETYAEGLSTKPFTFTAPACKRIAGEVSFVVRATTAKEALRELTVGKSSDYLVDGSFEEMHSSGVDWDPRFTLVE